MSFETARSVFANPDTAIRPIEKVHECADVREDLQMLVEDVGKSIHTYCNKRPQMAGLMIFVIGFYVGWKVKPW